MSPLSKGKAIGVGKEVPVGKALGKDKEVPVGLALGKSKMKIPLVGPQPLTKHPKAMVSQVSRQVKLPKTILPEPKLVSAHRRLGKKPIK